ncbi:MAG: hemolysin family protein [Acidobacteriaceae bacterium]|nr:hemolysin family protein [Acidobacteriaceae bacterium]
MSYWATILMVLLPAILVLAAYADRVYSEMGKFLAREYQDNVDAWEELVEPRLHLSRESAALSASVLRQLTLAAMALLAGLRLYDSGRLSLHYPYWADTARAAFELVLLVLLFDRLIPQILFARTSGRWTQYLRPLLQALFYLILPVTLLLGLLLSIAALAEPENTEEEEHPSEAMEALLEAGEEEGILEESDRELVRSVVEFGDMVVREVMTPRPDIFAVPVTLTLQEFIDQFKEHVFSRVPVYAGSLDQITGIVFAHDLLKVPPEATTVADIQRAAAFVPETKRVAEMLREMQREKQHMRIVIDEYGSVAGLVTIEDLLEAIVGDIADEHDEAEETTPVREADGAYRVPGSLELPRLRELFADEMEKAPEPAETEETDEPHEEELNPLRLFENYESTTVGGLVSEIAGHIPLPGEVVEAEGLRMEVLASTARRIDRVRVSLTGHVPA